MCDNKDLIVGFLYDDLSAQDRRALDAHLALCGECREEVAALRATRGHLSLWAPPEPDFGFRIIRDTKTPARSADWGRSRWVPAFGLAAAAVLVLAAATAIANLEVRYDNQGFAVRTGWARSAAPVAAEVEAPRNASGAVPANWRADFDALERRLRELETTTVAAANSVPVGGMSDAEMLRRVREIVREAESRQQVAVAQRLLQVVTDFDRQRMADLAVVQRGLGDVQGLANAEIAQTRDMLNQFMRVANRQEK